MAQESTFDAEIRSHANAIGLMQIVPATGRRYARDAEDSALHRRASSPTPRSTSASAPRTSPTWCERFGGVHHALASYNAGPSPVSRWIAEKPGVARDEFIDDIPYPETQNYVKRILGTAEDYRRLYSQGGGRLVPGAPGTAAAPARRRRRRRRPDGLGGASRVSSRRTSQSRYAASAKAGRARPSGSAD